MEAEDQLGKFPARINFRFWLNKGLEYVDPHATKLFGYAPEEYYKDPEFFYEIVHPDDLLKLLNVLKNLSEHRQMDRPIEIRWLHKDGQTIMVELFATPIYDETGKLVAIQGVARDVTEIFRYRERMEGLYRHASELVKAENIEAIAKTSFNIIEQVLGFDRGGFGVVEEGFLHFIHIRGAGINQPFKLQLNSKGVTVRAVRTKQTQLVSDTRKDDDYVLIATNEMRLSELAVPVMIGDQVVAVINLESNRLNAFTEQDQRLIEVFSEHIASALQRLQLLESERMQKTKISALHNNAKQLAEAKDIEEVCDIILKTTREVLGFYGVGIGIVEGDILRYVAQMDNKLPEKWTIPIKGSGITARAARTGQSQFVPDLRLDSDYVHSPLGDPEAFGTLSELAVPVFVDNAVKMVINLESPGLNGFSNEDQRLVETLGMHVASALSRLQKMEQLDRQSRQQTDYQKRLKALHTNATRLGIAETIEEIATETFNAIEGVLGFNQGGFGVVEGGILRFVHLRGVKTTELFELPLEGPGITVRVVRTGETQLVADIRMDRDFVLGPGSNPLSELAVPVKVDGQVVAVIDVESERLTAFGEEDREHLETLAHYVASALSGLRKREQLDRQGRRLTALHSSAALLAEAKTPEEIIKTAIAAMRNSLGFEVCSYLELEDDILVTKAVEGARMIGLRLRLSGRGITVRAAQMGRSVLISDTRLEPDFVQGGMVALSELAVPVKVDGEVVAVLNVESKQTEAYDEDDRRLMETLANHVASALKRLSLFESERLQKAKLAALHNSAARLGAVKSLEEVFDVTYETVKGILGFQWMSIGLVEGDVVHFVDFKDSRLEKGSTLALDGPGVTVRAVKTGRSQLIPDVSKDPDYHRLLPVNEPVELRSELVVPLFFHGRAEGVINVESAELNAFTEEDQKLLETLANHVSSALDRLSEVDRLERLVEQRTRELKEAERMATIGETAAMVGHDLRNPLQVMVNVFYLAKEKFESLPPPMKEVLTKEGLMQLLEMSGKQVGYMNKIILDLQDFARNLKPQLAETDLCRLVEEIFSTTEPSKGVEFSIQAPAGFPKAMVDPAMMKRLLTNMITNALQAMPNGGQLTVELSRTDEAVSISVHDTGVGIPEENLNRLFQPLFTTRAKGTGLGLPVCKRIAEAHGGTITVKSQVGKGSTFTVRIPLNETLPETYNEVSAKASPTASGNP